MIAAANLVNIFDPARLLISGKGLRATIPQHTFGPSRAPVDLIVCPMDETNWARGAASLILREVFQPPIYDEGEALAIDDLLMQVSGKAGRRKG